MSMNQIVNIYTLKWLDKSIYSIDNKRYSINSILLAGCHSWNLYVMMTNVTMTNSTA